MNGDRQVASRRIVPLLGLTCVAVPAIFRGRHEFAAMWPRFQPLIEQTLLIVATGILLAAVVAGWQAWRGVHD